MVTGRRDVVAYLKGAAEEGAPVFLEVHEVTTLVALLDEGLLAQLGLALIEAGRSA
jgi:hypothetical protein